MRRTLICLHWNAFDHANRSCSSKCIHHHHHHHHHHRRHHHHHHQALQCLAASCSGAETNCRVLKHSLQQHKAPQCHAAVLKHAAECWSTHKNQFTCVAVLFRVKPKRLRSAVVAAMAEAIKRLESLQAEGKLSSPELFSHALVEKVQVLLNDAELTGCKVAAWDQIQELLLADAVAWKARYPPNFVGVHAENRSKHWHRSG